MFAQKKQPSIPLDSTNQRPDFMVHVDESALHTAHTPQPSFVGMNGVLSSRKPGKGVSHDPLKNINKVRHLQSGKEHGVIISNT